MCSYRYQIKYKGKNEDFISTLDITTLFGIRTLWSKTISVFKVMQNLENIHFLPYLEPKFDNFKNGKESLVFFM